MNILKPIQTVYKGYRFRSRLEARWAVFFDELNLEWEYEKEGYDIAGEKYLPDFWLNDVNMWAEVKPLRLNDRERILANRLSSQTSFPILLLVGLPEDHPYEGIESDGFCYDFCLTNYHEYSPALQQNQPVLSGEKMEKENNP